MPFTLSHPAAAWLVRRWIPALPLDALVLGTMAPDFEYILRLRVYGRFGHTPLGVLAFCLPVGIVACVVFRAIVRPALVCHLPAGLRTPAPPDRWAASAAAVWAGSATHVVWDGFTHRTGWFVSRYPALGRGAAGLEIPWYSLLQHGSTLVGAVTIALWIASWLRRHPAEQRRFAPGERAASLRAAAFIAGCGALAAALNGMRGLSSGPERVVGFAAVGGMAGIAGAALTYGVLARRSRRR